MLANNFAILAEDVVLSPDDVPVRAPVMHRNDCAPEMKTAPYCPNNAGVES